jgi:hypothetical protein
LGDFSLAAIRIGTTGSEFIGIPRPGLSEKSENFAEPAMFAQICQNSKKQDA